ncbi:hypothetical protein JOD65_002813 [Nocardioides cavernae]|nr:hypothetical protein [Nocardioides cavernae]
MSSFRITRTDLSSRLIRTHALRRHEIIQASCDAPRRDRYRLAIAAGWRPLA